MKIEEVQTKFGVNEAMAKKIKNLAKKQGITIQHAVEQIAAKKAA